MVAMGANSEPSILTTDLYRYCHSQFPWPQYTNFKPFSQHSISFFRLKELLLVL